MPTFEECFRNADELAQRLVDAWGKTSKLTKPPVEYRQLLAKACEYRAAKRTADNHRKNDALEEAAAAEEMATRQGFAEAYKVFGDAHQAA